MAGAFFSFQGGKNKQFASGKQRKTNLKGGYGYEKGRGIVVRFYVSF